VTPALVNIVEWVVWIVSWLAIAVWSDRAVARASNQTGYRVVIVIGGLMLFSRLGISGPRWALAAPAAWTADAMAAAGFLFTWWARIHLGTLWSSQVTRKAHHRIVDTGPYGIVRHPIYTGLCVATLATMALRGTLTGVVGAATLITGYWMKARVEESFLREQLGPADYDAYARRVPMLIPFLSRG
jgi:protein-S-isoprenylcysteine O-methyltransferase Ste14